MKTLAFLLGLALLFPVAGRAQDAACQQFDALVARTYNFDESRLTDAQKSAKEIELDRFWTQVGKEKTKFLPCLRARVTDAKANPFFRFDGSNLLVELDPSLASRRTQVAVYLDTPLDVVGAGRWVSVLTLRGTEGFDVSRAAKRALEDDQVAYVAQNGDPVSRFDAALLLWASQSEARATPQLFALANDPAYAQREAALSILLQQATPQARALIEKLNRKAFSPGALSALERFEAGDDALVPRARPKTSRAQFVRAFEGVLQGDTDAFNALMRAVPDGEHDAAAVLTPADLPLLRRVRRLFLRGANQHSLAFYRDFTGVILAVMKKAAPAKTA